MPKWWFDASLKFISPILLTGLFIWNLVDLFRNGGIYGGYHVMNNIIFGWLLTLLMILMCFMYKLIIKHRINQGVNLDEKSWDEIDEVEQTLEKQEESNLESENGTLA